MVAETAPAMEKQRALALLLLVRKVDVVEPEGGVHASGLRCTFLLPIEPPEIDPLLLQWMMQEVHVVRRKGPVGQVERDVVLRRGIDAHRPRELRIGSLPRLHAACRMQVQRHLQTFVVQLQEEVLRVRKEGVVPRVAAPAQAMAALIIRLKMAAACVMPVHVDDENVIRHIVLVKAGHQIAKFLITVRPVA